MQLPKFSECSHPLIQSLFHHSDQELVTLMQRHPELGQYFVALFCRYSPIVFTLIRHAARSPVQAEYLFAATWRHLFHELRGLDLRQLSGHESAATEAGAQPTTIQTWLINVTAVCINQAHIPSVEDIHYSFADASPPFWCYVDQAIGLLPPMQRFIVLMAQTFRWSDTRIAAHLQAEGDRLSVTDVQQQLKYSYEQIERNLPGDIRTIYLPQVEERFSASHTENGQESSTFPDPSNWD